ncbi:hypothetical protein RD792_007469 [Penstemon davidsonii]|uniref:Uncharacterized protein n=1 Tax=Penstemon davidsonii TaxID=160366 RepID=A0ABR0D6J4_9LAMI|nr:hypothetical protein RD792_007469 [Penstemon davidsonii]
MTKTLLENCRIPPPQEVVAEVLGDVSSIVGFIRIWASIHKLGGDKEFFITQGESLPIFDRSIIIDPQGIDDKYWDLVKETPLKTATIPLPTGRGTTHILNRNDLTKLRKWLVTKNPGLGQVATFVVLAAYVWTCFVKSGEEVEDDEVSIFTMDLRGRIKNIPSNYFGNCLAYGISKMGSRELVGSEEFVHVVTKLAEDIKNRAMKVNDYGTPNDGMLQMLSDFGWGLPRKMEVVSIDGEKYSMSLCKSRFYEGGFEVGLSLPKQRMDKFDDIFSDGLRCRSRSWLEASCTDLESLSRGGGGFSGEDDGWVANRSGCAVRWCGGAAVRRW